MKKIISALTLVIATNTALAWGPAGHKIVAIIGQNNLTPKAKLEVKAILGNETMEAASIWADTIRQDPNWASSKPLHFVNIPDGETYEESHKDPHGDVIEAIDQCIAKLQNPKTTQEEKLENLRFLIHFVGDVHQPLHAGRAEDRGGNEIKINFKGKDLNLHSFWDSAMIETQGMNPQDYARRLQSGKAHMSVNDYSTEQVIKENMDLRDQVYAFKAPEIGSDYVTKNTPVVNARLLLGGMRLASILNKIYR